MTLEALYKIHHTTLHCTLTSSLAMLFRADSRWLIPIPFFGVMFLQSFRTGFRTSFRIFMNCILADTALVHLVAYLRNSEFYSV
jgi:hypothetical protein